MARRSRTESMIGFVKEQGPFREVPPVGVGVARVLWFLVVFLGCCLWIGSRLPRPPQSWTTVKLREFAERKDEFDLVFLGSSQIYRHVDPALFDEVMAAEGVPVHSFNFGVPGMGALENRWILEQVLAMEPARLETIVFDAPAPGVLLSGMNHVTPRVKTWHDLDTTLLALRIIRDAGMPTSWKVDMARRHLVSFGYKLCNVGSLREVLEWELTGTSETRADEERMARINGPGGLGTDERGWVSMNKAYNDSSPYQRSLLKQRYDKMQEEMDRWVKRVQEDPDRPRPLLEFDGQPREVQDLTPAEKELLGDLIAMTQAAGVRPLFTNAPDIRQKEYFVVEAAKAGVIPELVDMDDPHEHLELLDPTLRFDELHLHEKGAVAYTEALAKEIAELLKGAP